MVGLCQPRAALADSQSIVREAANAYEQGRYDVARDRYTELLKDPRWHGPALYNLGNIAARQKKLGEAAAFYREALQELPGDRDTRWNLNYALSNLGIRQFGGGKGTWELFRTEILNVITLDQVFVALLIVLFFSLFNTYKFLKKRKRARLNEEPVPTAPFIMFVWIFLFFIVGGTSICKIVDGYSGRGTVVSTKVDLRSGPGEANASLAELSEGYEVLIQEEAEGWKQVTALDGPRPGITGWVPNNSLVVTAGGGPW